MYNNAWCVYQSAPLKTADGLVPVGSRVMMGLGLVVGSRVMMGRCGLSPFCLNVMSVSYPKDTPKLLQQKLKERFLSNNHDQ